MKKIDEIESNQSASLEEILKMERRKYQEFKMELTESRSTESLKVAEERVRELRGMVGALERERSEKIKREYPEIE